MSVVRAEALRAHYVAREYGAAHRVRAVEDVEVEIQADETLGITGESGCGKSTLLRLLVGMVKPPLTVLAGRVLYQVDSRETDVLAASGEELRRIRWRFASYIPQGSMSVLNPTRKVETTFFDVIKAHGTREAARHARDMMTEHLKMFGLPVEVLRSYPHQLSGGMRQRVAIALATILRPRVIFADEPTTGLDVVVQRGIIQLLRDIRSQYRNTVVLVSHDMGVQANIADRIAVMYAGRVIEVGQTTQILRNPQHPYTRHLVESLPRIGDKRLRRAIPGSPPSLANPPSGCAFHPRCPHVMERCKNEVPQLRASNGNQVACFLVE